MANNNSINTSYRGWLDDNSNNSAHYFSGDIATYLQAASRVFNFFSNFTVETNENVYVQPITLGGKVKRKHSIFGTQGGEGTKNDFGITKSLTGLYNVDMPFDIGEFQSKLSLRAGKININGIVNRTISNLAVEFSHGIVEKLFENHLVSDPTVSTGVPKQVPNATVIAPINYAQPVYEQILNIIKSIKEAGALDPVLIISSAVETQLLLDNRYMNASNITKEEIQNGFTGRLDGCSIITDYSISDSWKNDAGVEYECDVIAIENNADQIKLLSTTITPLHIADSQDPKDYGLTVLKSSTILGLVVVDPLAIIISGKKTVPSGS